MEPDGSAAEISSSLTETWADPGGKVIVTSEEKYIVEMRSGKPRIRSLVIRAGELKPRLK